MNKILLISLVIFVLLLNVLLGTDEYNFFNWSNLSNQDKNLLMDLSFQNRIPRTLLAAFSGMSCAMVGLILQTLFKNPLAGPTTLGVNAGASLGVAFYYFAVSSLGFVPLGLGSSIFSIIGALIFLFLLVFVSQKYQSITLLLIVGLMLGYVAYSLIEILVQSSSSDGIKGYVFWGMGSFNSPNWFKVALIAIGGGLSLIYFLIQTKQFNLYLLGDEELILAGLQPKKIRIKNLLIAGILIGIVTAIVGPLAFVGIAVPNFLKLFLKTLNHKVLIPLNALLGAGFVVLADLFSRGVVWDIILPLNATLSLMAFPIIALLLLSRKHGIGA